MGVNWSRGVNVDVKDKFEVNVVKHEWKRIELLCSAMTSVIERLYGNIVISENATFSSQLPITTSTIHQKQRYVTPCMTPNVDCVTGECEPANHSCSWNQPPQL